MYSEKLKKEKLTVKENGEALVGLEIGKDAIFAMIDQFCTKDDIIGVPNPKLFALFDEFCVEKGYPKINHMTQGRMFREKFNVTRKRVRKGKELFWVYVPNVK